MHPDLRLIHQRLEEYEAELEAIIRQYGDKKSMWYFSDRFGPDHPMSARADEGVRIQQTLFRMKSAISKFSASFDAEFPALNDD